MKKLVWRISPGQSGLNRTWYLERVERNEGNERCVGYGFYKTLKAAKAMAAHLKRKPIELL